MARKSDTQSIVGYACFLELEGGCYLMRIGVRSRCQRQGIGRELMNFMLEKYNNLSLEVSTDNAQAMDFYQKMKLELSERYTTQEGVEFAKFNTPKGYVFDSPVSFAENLNCSDESELTEVKSQETEDAKEELKITEEQFPEFQQLQKVKFQLPSHAEMTPQHKNQPISGSSSHQEDTTDDASQEDCSFQTLDLNV